MDGLIQVTTASRPDVPIYPSGDALSLLAEIAETVESWDESTLGPMDGVILSADDAKALRWAVKELTHRQTFDEYNTAR